MFYRSGDISQLLQITVPNNTTEFYLNFKKLMEISHSGVGGGGCCGPYSPPVSAPERTVLKTSRASAHGHNHR